MYKRQAKDNPTVDAGLYSPKGSIGDYVWKDQNNNGVQESGEPAVAGVIVQLLNATTSAVLATDTTNAQGLYLFPNLESGTYQVKVVTTSLPAGCVISSQQDQGGDDTKLSLIHILSVCIEVPQRKGVRRNYLSCRIDPRQRPTQKHCL